MPRMALVGVVMADVGCAQYTSTAPENRLPSVSSMNQQSMAANFFTDRFSASLPTANIGSAPVAAKHSEAGSSVKITLHFIFQHFSISAFVIMGRSL